MPKIVTDISKHPIWCEDPHLYKINKTYYLKCAQGGTGPAHTEAIFKSDSLRGPYLPWEKNPLIAAQDLPANIASIELKIEGAGPATRCFHEIDSEFTQLGQDLQSSFFTTDTAGGFQGVTLGIFAYN